MTVFLVCGILTLVIAISTQILFQIVRSRQFHHLELIPNCLLTRHPLIFISGRRSLFYFLNYWNQIPRFLREHGYEVHEIHLPWRNPTGRIETLKQEIQKRRAPCHLIGDSSIETELHHLVQLELPNIASLNLVQLVKKDAAPSRITSADLKPRSDGIKVLHLRSPKRAKTLKAHIIHFWQQLQLSLHRLMDRQHARLRCDEVGLPLTAEAWSIERAFLEFAISLAENDLRWSP